MYRVGEMMETNVPTLPWSMPVAELMQRIARGDPQLALWQAFPIMDENNHLAGIITRGDLVRAITQESSDGKVLTVLDAGKRDPIVAYPDELLRDAVERMLINEVGRLPVISRETPYQLVGYLGRTGVMQARLRRMRDEVIRERMQPGLT
jgi:CBS domain-containing protein